MTPACPLCAESRNPIVYTADAVPVQCGILMPSRKAALRCPQGRIRLAFCRCCGFVYNAAFDQALTEYSLLYNETQTFSPTFNVFHRRLADGLISRYGLRGKTIVEVGCGKGEFLKMLCAGGMNHGVGFDPSYEDDAAASAAAPTVRFINEYYSDKYTSYAADFLCCNMTLEHIPRPAELLALMCRAVEGSPDAVVFVLVPDAGRIVREGAFWDVQYEHCSYFTGRSLERLFRNAGFDVEALQSEFSGQYLSIAARARGSAGRRTFADAVEPGEEDLGRLANRCQQQADLWKQIIAGGRRTALWGAGSKAVSFLTTLGIGDEVSAVVDINPARQGTWIPGSGHPIVAPEYLMESRPDTVIVMNPVYRDEIGRALGDMGLHPEVLCLA